MRSRLKLVCNGLGEIQMKPSNSVTVLLSHKDFHALIAEALPDIVNKPYDHKIVCTGIEIGAAEVTIDYNVQQNRK